MVERYTRVPVKLLSLRARAGSNPAAGTLLRSIQKPEKEPSEGSFFVRVFFHAKNGAFFCGTNFLVITVTVTHSHTQLRTVTYSDVQ